MASVLHARYNQRLLAVDSGGKVVTVNIVSPMIRDPFRKTFHLHQTQPILLKTLIVVWFSFGISAPHLHGQVRQSPPVSQSDLGRQNMSRVAASVGQLVAIFHRDPGLMVELKRLIAKDATDHGQLISETDLTDEAIFDRLENDITFRSLATGLVQKYGFLKPTINPESPMAQEQQLLIRERAKWIAQDEEASRSRSRQQQQTKLEESQPCDPVTSDCSAPGGNNNASIQQLPSRYYLRNWSLTFDLQIISMTLLRIFSSKNAY